MHRIRVIAVGTFIGILLGLLNLLAIYAAALLFTGLLMAPGLIALLALLKGALLGAVSTALHAITEGRERSVLVVLAALALAALAVLLGHYSSRSLTPLAIYILTIVNALFIARLTGRLGSDLRPRLG